MSDLVFNHSQVSESLWHIHCQRANVCFTIFQHDALLTTCEGVIAPSQPESKNPAPQVLVFFTHHRPHLAHKDMDFFEKAKERGWRCEEILTERFSVRSPRISRMHWGPDAYGAIESRCSLRILETKRLGPLFMAGD